MADSPEQCAARLAEIEALTARKIEALNLTLELAAKVTLEIASRATTVAEAKSKLKRIQDAFLAMLKQSRVVVDIDIELDVKEAEYVAAGCGTLSTT